MPDRPLTGTDMSDATPLQDVFDTKTYEDATQRLQRLKAALSPSAVQLIAREVLSCVASRPPANTPRPTPPELEGLAKALTGLDDGAGARIVDTLRQNGTPVEDIYLCHLAPVAEMLGEWWKTDHISFMDVTLASARIFGIMRALPDPWSRKSSIHQPSAILALVPGDQHSIGLKMTSDLLRQDGWDIIMLEGLDHDQLIERIGKADQTLIGLSAGSERSLPALARLVVGLRIRRPDARLVLGGKVLNAAAHVIDEIGVDGLAHDLDEARELMVGFLQDGDS